MSNHIAKVKYKTLAFELHIIFRIIIKINSAIFHLKSNAMQFI